jgi:hypothetical protein
VNPRVVGAVTVTVPAAAAKDSANNNNTASNALTRTNTNQWLPHEGQQRSCASGAGPTGVTSTVYARVVGGQLQTRITLEAYCCGMFHDSGWATTPTQAGAANACCGFGWVTYGNVSVNGTTVYGDVDFGGFGSYTGACSTGF